MRYVRGFFAFWYDFIVGDAWEVAAGVVLCLLAAFLLLRYAGEGASVYLAVALPSAVVLLLGYSLWRVRGNR